LDTGFAQSAALKQGLVSLGGEFGGGGSVSVEGVRIVEHGLRNILAHAGILRSAPTVQTTATRLVEVKNRNYFVLASDAGLFEPFTELGENVEAGQPCGQVHFVDNPGREPVITRFRVGGTVISKRHFGRTERGDCVAHLATDWNGWS
jgi:predicted deacylase